MLRVTRKPGDKGWITSSVALKKAHLGLGYVLVRVREEKIVGKKCRWQNRPLYVEPGVRGGVKLNPLKPRTNQIDQTDRDLLIDRLLQILSCRCERLSKICNNKQYRSDPGNMCCIDHADYTSPTRQHELDHTRSGTDLPCLADLHH